MDIRDQSKKDTLIEAIEKRTPVSLSKREEYGKRLVHPHILFCRKAELGINLNVWQVRNSGKPQDEPGWRMLNLEDLGEVALLNGTFEVQRGFNPYSDRYVGSIIASVEP